MSITQNSVVTLHYTLKNDAGEVLESTADGQPMSYLHGQGNLIPGLERELTGKSVGDSLSVKVLPADGYGERNPSLVQEVPRHLLDGVRDLRLGMRLRAETDQGPRSVLVTKIADEAVTLDANHPLAGQTLHFDIEIAEVREATRDELTHGHVHGPGGHHHG
jgi:FKBP-type peptidyl-prolyl cis-trans isomerase SlyD